MSINWVEYIKAQEDKALEEVYNSYRTPFINWALKKGNCSKEDAIDLFQVSVVILYENVISGKIEKLDNLKSYLFTIGRNKILEHYRSIKKNKHQSLESKNLLHSVFIQENEIDDSTVDEFELMHESILELGDPCGTLLQNFYFKKMDLKEIARHMNYKNSDTVKTKKFKCIQRLKIIFAKKMEAQNI